MVVVEDGPTITHGSMPSGAGLVAARTAGAAAIVDPRPVAGGELGQIYDTHRHIGPVVPAIGYTAEFDLSLWLGKVRALVGAWGTQAEHRSRVLAELTAAERR